MLSEFYYSNLYMENDKCTDIDPCRSVLYMADHIRNAVSMPIYKQQDRADRTFRRSPQMAWRQSAFHDDPLL